MQNGSKMAGHMKLFKGVVGAVKKAMEERVERN
jgi:hypothetical protein